MRERREGKWREGGGEWGDEDIEGPQWRPCFNPVIALHPSPSFFPSVFSFTNTFCTLFMKLVLSHA